MADNSTAFLLPILEGMGPQVYVLSAPNELRPELKLTSLDLERRRVWSVAVVSRWRSNAVDSKRHLHSTRSLSTITSWHSRTKYLALFLACELFRWSYLTGRAYMEETILSRYLPLPYRMSGLAPCNKLWLTRGLESLLRPNGLHNWDNRYVLLITAFSSSSVLTVRI